MDLSKIFDCIPHDLIITRLHTYGFDENSLVLVYSFLKERKQSVRINNTYSSFHTILAGVPQGSVLGLILFNFYINDLILFIKEATLCNYADDNTSNLIGVLEEEAGVALNWLEQNQMIANQGKFHAILVKKNRANLSGENLRYQK